MSQRFDIRPDPDANPLLMALPLRGEVSKAVAKDLNGSGYGENCAACGKPFNAVRKQRAVGRMSHIDPSGGLYTTAWIFCGACAASIRRDGGRMPAHLVQEAREATSAGILLATPAAGSA